jgi:ubiquinone/menaquinone biosynthesis C-methylase UbiE
MPPSFDHPRPLVDLLGTITAGRVLDVGAGTGQFTRVLTDCLAGFDEIVGIDTDACSLDRAKQAFPEPNVTFEQADAEKLPFPSGHFDTVAIAYSLHHFENLDGVVAELRRVTRPEGTWIVVEMHSDARTPEGKNAVDLHLWGAAVDRALGRFHDPVYTHQNLVAKIDALRLARHRTVEWQDENNENAKKNVEAAVQVIQQVLERAEGKEAYDALADRASALIERIRQHGLGSQPFLLAVGTPEGIPRA